MNTGASPAPTQEGNLPLAQWLLLLLSEQRTPAPVSQSDEEEGRVRRLHEEVHREFEQQVPDFVTALLLQDESTTVQYASLLYHLLGCDRCHRSYLEVYDAMRAVLSVAPDEEAPPP